MRIQQMNSKQIVLTDVGCTSLVCVREWICWTSFEPKSSCLGYISVRDCWLEWANRAIYTGWPKKVSHYRESSLNRIKNRQPGYIFQQFW